MLHLLTILLAIPACAQTSDGRITGVVLDPSGGVIPHAKVSAQNLETGVVHAAESNAEGSYLMFPLMPGRYSLTVEAPGFRPERVEGLSVEVATVIRRDITLSVGSIGQEVAVVSVSAAPLLTESISVENTILRDQIEGLPLNGRDFSQLVLLSAGAVENAYPGRDFGPVAANGNRAYSNDYSLDGTPNNNVFGGGSAAAVSVDVIREFKVTSGVAPPEYGQAGTQVTIVTRGGNNQIHFSLYEYHRGTTWQASNPFNPGAAQPFERNQFGGSVGGPIRRNRAFYFFNYEGTRQNQAATRVSSVPLDAFWAGDFSSLLARGITLRDPLGTGRPVIPGNRVDQYLGGSRINQTALKLRPYWGSPNKPGTANNLVLNADSTAVADQFTTRLDYALPRNQSLLLRYTQSSSDAFNPSILGSGPGVNPTGKNYNASFGWTAPINAVTVSEVRFGYAQLRNVTNYVDAGLPTTASIGIAGFDPPSISRQPLPRINFTGNDAFQTLNYGNTATYGLASQDQGSRLWNLAGNITMVRGKHTLKAGAEHRRLVLPALLQPASAGVLAFSSTAATSSGYTFADFLMGLPSSSTQTPPMPPTVLRQREVSSYIQDEWRVARRLTLSMGLRHEYLANPVEDKNRLAMFDPVTGAIVVASNDGELPIAEYAPSIVAKLTDATGKWRFPLLSDKQAGFHPRSLIDPNYRHFAPRFGFVASITRNKSLLLRGGYGIFYTRYPYQYLEQTTAVNPPFGANFSFIQTVTNGVAAITTANPYAGAAGSTIAPGGLQRNFSLPDNQQWNLTLERDLGWGTALSLGYVGNKGSHLFRSANANGAYLDPATKQIVRQYASTFGNVAINMRTTSANSIYNAMQTEFRRRSRKGLQFQANWTWAKGLDNVGTAVNSNPLDVQNLGRDRADSDYVRRHMVKFNGVWDLPFGRGHAFFGGAPRWLDTGIGGWKLSGIWSFTGGARLTPTFTAAGGLANNRPDVVYGAALNLPRAERGPSRWYNVAALAPVPATDPTTGLARYGNAGRNIIVGPGTNVADTSLSKSFAIFGEGRLLTFRAEMFNAFNHPNYDLPDANISNVGTAGTITNIIKPMRQAQFALRFDF